MKPENFEEAKWLKRIRLDKCFYDYRNGYLNRRSYYLKFDFPKCFYFKILNDRCAIHWAVIREENKNYVVYFINAEGKAFDKLEFKTKKQAQRALRRNKFYFSTNKKCPYLPINPIYVRLGKGKKSAPYSKGNLWDNPERNKFTKKVNKKSYFSGKHNEFLGSAWGGLFGNSDNYCDNYLNNILKSSSHFGLSIINNKKYIPLWKYFCHELGVFSWVKQTEQGKEFVTSYPVLDGYTKKVQLKAFHIWKNKIEGTMAAVELDSGTQTPISFFNPLFLSDIKKYHYNKVVYISLSAIAITIQKVEHQELVIDRGAFYDFELNKFLKANPDKTEKDFENPIINLDGETFRMFVPEKYVPEYEAAGQIMSISKIQAFDREYTVMKVDYGHIRDGEQFIMNVYASPEILKDYVPKVGDGIAGVIWLNGYITEPEVQDKNPVIKHFISGLVLILLAFATITTYNQSLNAENNPRAKQESRIVKEYMQEMNANIKQNWEPPSGNKHSRVVINFKVNKEGNVSKIIFNSAKSKNVTQEYIDAAIDAIKNTKIKKPPRKTLENGYVDIEFTFDYD